MNKEELKESIRTNTNRFWKHIELLNTTKHYSLESHLRRRWDRLWSNNCSNKYGLFSDLAVSELYILDNAIKKFNDLFVRD